MAKGNIEYKDHPGPGGYCIIEGNLGKDPERRESGDKTFVKFSVGTSVYDFRVKDRIAVWVEVTVSGYSADRHYDNLKKGDKVSIIGQLSVTTGEDLDSGEEVKVYWKMFATEIHYTGRGKRDDDDDDDQNGSDEEPEEEEKPRRKKQRQSKEEEAPVSDEKDEVDDLFD